MEGTVTSGAMDSALESYSKGPRFKTGSGHGPFWDHDNYIKIIISVSSF